MAGKYGPKENSVMTCDMLIAKKNMSFTCYSLCEIGKIPTIMVRVFIAGVPVAQRRDM